MRLNSHKRRFSRKPAAFFDPTLPEPFPAIPPARNEIPGADDGFIKAKEAAEWLGIPLRSFNQYVQRKLLPSYKLGRHRLFRKSQLVEALGANFIASRNAIFR
ncbi:MAG: helix-turn-helix domain-containing protein [Verrucomicrobia bacterium]|nr:helix-turn-helix domain-containing protein [Verrucomicrobiota bacterium]